MMMIVCPLPHDVHVLIPRTWLGLSPASMHDIPSPAPFPVPLATAPHWCRPLAASPPLPSIAHVSVLGSFD